MDGNTPSEPTKTTATGTFDADMKLVYISAGSISLLVTLLGFVYQNEGDLSRLDSDKIIGAAGFWLASMLALLLSNIFAAKAQQLARFEFSYHKLEFRAVVKAAVNENDVLKFFGKKLRQKVEYAIRCYDFLAQLLKILGYIFFVVAYVFALLLIKDIS